MISNPQTLASTFVMLTWTAKTSTAAGRIVGYSRSQGFVEWPDRQTAPVYGAFYGISDGGASFADADGWQQPTDSIAGTGPAVKARDGWKLGSRIRAGYGLCAARRTNGSWSQFQLPDAIRSAAGQSIDLEQGWEFVRQSGSRPMMLATSLGLFELQADGTLEAEYLPMYNAVWVLTQHGVVAKYY